MSREAMQVALEALELYQSKSSVQMFDDAVKALRQALETEQEPVAWRFRSGTWFNREVQWRYIDTLDGAEGLRGLQPLYTEPPKREWVGLTDEEVNELVARFKRYAYVLLREVEAKLKEKNHG